MTRRSRVDRHRVVIVVENLPLARDRRLGKQVRTLVGAGHDVTVICPRDPGNGSWTDVDVLDYPPAREATSKISFLREYGWSWLMVAFQLLRVSLRSRVDVLQFCGPPDIFFPFAVVARALGTPVVYDQRDPSPELYAARYGRDGGLVHGLLRLCEAASYRTADEVLTVNESLQELARERGGVPASRVTVVGNGPVLATLAGAAPEPGLRAGRARLCCWVGAMGPQDRVDIALRAVRELVHRRGRVDCHFAFVGDGEALADAVRLSRDLEVDEWVSFPGFVSQERVFTYLATADIGIDPGLDPTVSPVKAFEYMALGLPVVAFDLREVRRLADEAAVYAAPGDVAGFAGLVDDLLADPAERRRRGGIGRRRVAEGLAWDHQEQRYLGVFGRLLQPQDDVVPAGEPPLRRRTGTAARPVPGTPLEGSAG